MSDKLDDLCLCQSGDELDQFVEPLSDGRELVQNLEMSLRIDVMLVHFVS